MNLPKPGDIILLDLNHTLVENSEDKAKPFSKQIEGERYRLWLANWLRTRRVFMLTARPQQHEQQTMQSIADKLAGWQPERAYFNAGYGAPPDAKSKMLDLIVADGVILAECFAVESNPATRVMYARRGIAACTAAQLKEGLNL